MSYINDIHKFCSFIREFKNFAGVYYICITDKRTWDMLLYHIYEINDLLDIPKIDYNEIKQVQIYGVTIEYKENEELLQDQK